MAGEGIDRRGSAPHESVGRRVLVMVRTVLACCIVALVFAFAVALVVGGVWASIESGYHWSGDHLAFWPHGVAIIGHIILGGFGVVVVLFVVLWAFDEVWR